jgi:hypothetical protein
MVYCTELELADRQTRPTLRQQVQRCDTLERLVYCVPRLGAVCMGTVDPSW